MVLYRELWGLYSAYAFFAFGVKAKKPQGWGRKKAGGNFLAGWEGITT
jgi:hypothetical protein